MRRARWIRNSCASWVSRSMSRRWSRLLIGGTLGILLVAAGCSMLPFRRSPTIAATVKTLAILPLEPEESPSDTRGADQPPRLTADAAVVVTAQVYGVLAGRSRWRVVPDLSVQ